MNSRIYQDHVPESTTISARCSVRSVATIRRSIHTSLALACAASLYLFASLTWCATAEDVQARIDATVAKQQPIVVHVAVALCDNLNQGIVPVPEIIGNGQDPRTNLYWGALYGVRTHLTRVGGWKFLTRLETADPHILERAVFSTTAKRSGVDAAIYLVADAWDGAHIKAATARFLEWSAGRDSELLTVEVEGKSYELRAGADAHLIAYIGHNGLMDFSLPIPEAATPKPVPRSALVLACASKEYFAEAIQESGSHPLLLTTGLMAPEAYTLDAAIRAWVGSGKTADVVEAAAQAYHRYQQCGAGAARRLFFGAP